MKRIAVLPGDGIGEEVMAEAIRVLRAVEPLTGERFELTHALVGGAAYERYESHFPAETRAVCEEADAILFGSVGGPVSEMHLPKWKNCEASSILAVRSAFRFHANLRPVKVLPELAEMCPLRPEVVAGGVDILFVRELLGDLYFGEHRMEVRDGVRIARDVAEYDEKQVRAVAVVAFEAARGRHKRVTSVDKANVLETSKLWRAVVREVAEDFPDCRLNEMLVDNCAMQLVVNPSQFDVVLTTNMFGDILSDVGAVLPGSLGLMCSASFNERGFALYEPPGGSAPDIAGQGIANPIAQILCVAMMLRHSFRHAAAADAIETAVDTVLRDGLRTRDIARGSAGALGTREMTDKIVERIGAA